LRLYETLFAIKPDLSKEEMEEVIEGVKKNIFKNKGEILLIEDMGKKNLAYEVQKYKTAYYILIYFRMDPANVENLYKFLRYSEPIIRYIVVKLEYIPEKLKNILKKEEVKV